MSPEAALAAALHATVTDHLGDVRINVAGGFIYDSGPRGDVKLQRYGHPVAKLGTWDAGTDALVKAYRAALIEVAS